MHRGISQRKQDGQEQPRSNSRDGRAEANNQRRNATHKGRACQLQKGSGKAIMAYLHLSRHQLCCLGIGKRFTRTNTTQPTQTQTTTTTPERYTAPHDVDTTNAIPATQWPGGSQCLCGRRLGRLPDNKKINKRIYNDPDGFHNTSRQLHASSGSTVISRISIIRNLHSRAT